MKLWGRSNWLRIWANGGKGEKFLDQQCNHQFLKKDWYREGKC
jgi:hypothetical protein